MRLLGIDLGSKRIGIAISDAEGWTAHALTVVARHGGLRDLEDIARLVVEHEVDEVVLGLPLNMDDSEGPAAERTRKFGQRLQAHLGLPLHYCDERLSTFAAEELLKEACVKPRKRKQVVDQLAAALILESYINSQNEREP